MRTEKEIIDLIIDIAKKDERIRAVMMDGSRADPDAKKDKYQDYDIKYFVKDISPFYGNTEWVVKHFGNPIIMQMPESMDLIPPSGDGHFCWLMIFEDGVRIDLSIEFSEYIDDGEPVIVLLDKDGFLPKIEPNRKHWHIRKPSQKHFYDCCTEFWWCLNNIAKGIARDELPYTMNMYNCFVKNMLDMMIEWYIGVNYDFSISTGKNGRYFKKFLSETLYEKYKKTFSDSNYENLWNSMFSACELFHYTAEKVAKYLNVEYNQNEENGMLKYLNMVKKDCI
jgi:aminoglycoside 6-adenylyltransferase